MPLALNVQKGHRPIAPAGRPFTDIIRHFTPNWFAASMGTGILAICLGQFHQIAILRPAGEGLWIANMILFTVCTVLHAARWIAFPGEACRIFGHDVMSMFLGCIPMGLATIVNGFVLFGPGLIGNAAVDAAHYLWWIDVALAVAVGVGVPFAMFTRQTHSVEQMTAVWLLPVVASEVAAVSGGLILPHLPAAAQMDVLFTSLILWALSVPLALGILVILFLRMVLHKLPHAGMAASSWLSLGPIGTGALGLFVFAQVAPVVLAAHGLAVYADGIAGACAIAGILLWAYGLWWMATAALVTIRYLREGFAFNLGWWGYTFPVGVYALATLRLGTMFPVPMISVFGIGLVIALGVMWVNVAARTVRGAVDQSLFVAPCLGR